MNNDQRLKALAIIKKKLVNVRWVGNTFADLSEHFGELTDKEQKYWRI